MTLKKGVMANEARALRARSHMALVSQNDDNSHDLSCDSLQQVAKPISACDQNSGSHQTFTIGCMYIKSTEIARPKNRTIRCD